METEDIYDVIDLTQKSISQIHFRSAPDIIFLRTLADTYGDKITFHFPTDLYLGMLDKIAEEFWAPNLISAHMQSDIFTDSKALYCFSHLEIFSLFCKLPKGSFFDEEDLQTFTHTIPEALPKLKKLVITILVDEEAANHTKQYLYWPNSQFEIEIITPSKQNKSAMRRMLRGRGIFNLYPIHSKTRKF